MRRNQLSTAVAAAVVGVAGIAASNAALYLNPDGTGQVLIYPYYTVNNNLQTLISVVNTTEDVKAVKVRFLEGRNSREVLDFNLYLSQFDVWVAALTRAGAGATDPARLVTPDLSCTVPQIPAGGVNFRNFAYASGVGLAADAGPRDLGRTREGHLEIIEMGVVRDEAAPSPFTPATWATHVNGVPDNCPELSKAWSPPNGAWLLNRNRAIEPPTGGLFGNAAIVDVDNGVMYTYAAEAIDGFSAQSNHTNPDNLLPNLSSNFTQPALRSSIVFYQGTQVTGEWANAIDATTSVFMHSALLNEYNVEPVFLGETEWVVTFPTKHFYVDEAIVGGAAIRPFVSRFRSNAWYLSLPEPRPPREILGACEPVSLTIYDREETTPIGGIDFSPAPPGAISALCWESQVLTFNQAARASAGQPSLLLGSRLYFNIQPPYQSGWLKLDFINGAPPPPARRLRPTVNPAPPNALVYRGLPATGFAIQRYINANAQPGVLANYSGAWRHRGERTIDIGQ